MKNQIQNRKKIEKNLVLTGMMGVENLLLVKV